ncbi:MAG: ATP-binding cassette domain-containing protein, partial [Thermoplasmata archaeon]
MATLDLSHINAGYLEAGQFCEKIHDVSISVRKGEIVGITGPSGSGKSTIIKTVLAQTAIRSGIISFEDHEVNVSNLKDYRKNVVYVPQNSLDSLDFLWTVRDQVKKVMKQHGLEYSDSELENSADLVEIDKSVLDRRSFEISYGTRHKVVLLMALSAAPKAKLVIMDEPTTSQDSVSSLSLLKTIKNIAESQKISFIVASSNPEPVFYLSDNVYVIYGGWIIENGIPSEIVRKSFHPYTEMMIRYLPSYVSRSVSPVEMLLNEETQGCPFYGYCDRRIE